jgi:hypothetical protein
MLAKYNDLLLRLFVAFGLLTAITGIAQYISGKQVNDALEETIETLKKDQQGRHLSEAKFGQLTNELRAITKPNLPIRVDGSQGNVESVKYGMMLMQALKDAGFAVSGVGEVWGFGGGIGPGVQIRSAEAVRGIAKSIGVAFEAAGVDGVQVPDDNVDHLTGDNVEILVGYRPLEN